MHARRRGRGNELDHIVAVGHGIERVGHRPVEAQGLRRAMPVDRMRRASKRRCAERRFVQACTAVGEAAAVAAEHLDVRQQVMAEGDRLRGLQMREARHDGRGILVGALDERFLQVAQHRLDLVDRVAHPQAHIECDLVVARTTRVQAPAGRTDQVGEPRLDVEMDVLELGRELETAGLDFALYLLQATLDRSTVLGREDAARHQHFGMGERARDVLRIQALVETDGGVDLLHDLGGAELVAAAPHRVGAALLHSRSCVLSCHE